VQVVDAAVAVEYEFGGGHEWRKDMEQKKGALRGLMRIYQVDKDQRKARICACSNQISTPTD